MSGFYGIDENVTNCKRRICVSRKPHICHICKREVQTGEKVFYENAFLYGKSFFSYTCLDCVKKKGGMTYQ